MGVCVLHSYAEVTLNDAVNKRHLFVACLQKKYIYKLKI